MRSIFRLAIRFLAIRRSGAARFAAIAGLFGISLSVVSLIFANAVTRGFQEELRSRLLAETPHITVTRQDGSPIENWRELQAELAQVADRAEITGFSGVSAMIIGEKTIAFALVIVEYDEPGRGSTGVVFGSELAKKLGLSSTGEAEAVILSDDGDVRKVRLRITSVSSSGLYDKDATVVQVSPSEFAAITGRLNEAPDRLQIKMRDPVVAASVAENIRNAIGSGYFVVDWQESNRALFSALDLEKRLAFALIVLIAILAASSVSSSIAILVTERRGDIAILRACGANAATIRMIFLLQSAFIGIIGSTVGIVVGIVVCWIANHFGLAEVSSEIYMINQITLAPTIAEVTFAAGLMLLVTMFAGIYPAILASRVKPMDDLRRPLT